MTFWLPAPEKWQEQAICAQCDPDSWYPDKGGSSQAAKKICLGCPVIRECLEYALAQDERFGVWGGMSERERRRLRSGARGGDDYDYADDDELAG